MTYYWARYRIEQHAKNMKFIVLKHSIPWKQCSCELETSYYNQQGKDCFLGTLRATVKLSL